MFANVGPKLGNCRRVRDRVVKISRRILLIDRAASHAHTPAKLTRWGYRVVTTWVPASGPNELRRERPNLGESPNLGQALVTRRSRRW